MKPIFKNQLSEIFEPPVSPKKERFLSTLNYPKVSFITFTKSQFQYIRPYSWLFSFCLLLFTLFGSPLFDEQLPFVWIIASLLPFVSLTIIAEVGRSTRFGMNELESACTYSLAQIVLARITILATTNFVLLILMQLALYKTSSFSFLRFSLCFYLPLFLASFFSLFIINRLNSANFTFVSAIICSIVCILGLTLLTSFYLLFLTSSLFYMGILMILLLFGIKKELHNFLRKMEENLWNSYLSV